MLTPPEIWFPNLNIVLYHVNRVAFTIFGIPVYWYGVLIVIGVALETARDVESQMTLRHYKGFLD